MVSDEMGARLSVRAASQRASTGATATRVVWPKLFELSQPLANAWRALPIKSAGRQSAKTQPPATHHSSVFAGAAKT